MRRRRLVAFAVTTVVVLSGAGLGCRRSDDAAPPPVVDRRDFAARLVEREKITDAQATCVTDYVYGGYEPEAIQVLYDQGVTGLPSPLWAEFGHAMVGCSFHDELVGGTTPRRPTRSGS